MRERNESKVRINPGSRSVVRIKRESYWILDLKERVGFQSGKTEIKKQIFTVLVDLQGNISRLIIGLVD